MGSRDCPDCHQDEIIDGHTSNCPFIVRGLRSDVERLTRELDTERMRLAACGVAALANTPGTAAKQRDCLPEYRSASFDDVCAAVDREMAERSRAEKAEAQVARLQEAVRCACDNCNREFVKFSKQRERAEKAEAERDEARADIRRLAEQRDTAKALAVVRGEDWAKLDAELMQRDQRIEALERQRDAEKSRSAKLVEALEQHGEHDDDCRAWSPGSRECNCGLDSALAAAKEET